MKKIFGNTAVFVVLYLLFMIPTYVLPFLGSNSSMINTLGVAQEGMMNPSFWLHLTALVVLVVLTWFRGANVAKTWLIIFPILALVFDLAPVLSSIPMIPSVMHLLAIILGVVGGNAAATVPVKEI